MSRRWDWLQFPDPFSPDLSGEEQAEGDRLWSELVAQRDKLSGRLSWLAANEPDEATPAEEHREWDERREATSRSRARFEAMLEGLGRWAGVGVGDVAQLLLDQEEARGEPAPGRAAAPTERGSR